MNPKAANAAIAESQQRCSDQNHLWRHSTLGGMTHMRCRCGAVHPNDLAAFLAPSGDQVGEQ